MGAMPTAIVNGSELNILLNLDKSSAKKKWTPRVTDICTIK
jgi:hypothetical protein